MLLHPHTVTSVHIIMNILLCPTYREGETRTKDCHIYMDTDQLDGNVLTSPLLCFLALIETKHSLPNPEVPASLSLHGPTHFSL